MSVIKYSVKFKRILTMTVREGQRLNTVRVGEVQNFQQNIDGTLDIVAYIWPQTSKKLLEMIEKNPGLMGMTAETQPVVDHLCFPDGTKFDEVEQEEDVSIVKIKEDIDALYSHILGIEKVLEVQGMIVIKDKCEHEFISKEKSDSGGQMAICRKCGYEP